jgi:predicted enzyme related to lactoylglutathione lyase
MTFILPTGTEKYSGGDREAGGRAGVVPGESAPAEETALPRRNIMASPVVHFEIRSADPDASRKFYGQLFGWTFPDGGIPGYSYVETGTEGAIPGGISPLQDGAPLVTFFVGVADVAGTLEAAVAAGGRVVQPATQVPGVTFGLLADPQGQVVGVACPAG